jgi:type IV pilus assembly protein PilO
MDQLIDRILKASLAAKAGGIAGAVILVTAINFFFFVSPAADTIENQRSKISSLEQQLAEKQEIAQNLNERRREMEVLEQKLAEARTELPDTVDMDDLLGQLNDEGKKAGLMISSVEPGGEAPAGFFAQVPIRMSVHGNYHEIAMFMQEVSQMRRIVNVSDIQLGTPSMVNQKVVLNSSFLATTFRFLAPKANQGDKKGHAR